MESKPGNNSSRSASSKLHSLATSDHVTVVINQKHTNLAELVATTLWRLPMNFNSILCTYYDVTPVWISNPTSSCQLTFFGLRALWQTLLLNRFSVRVRRLSPFSTIPAWIPPWIPWIPLGSPWHLGHIHWQQGLICQHQHLCQCQRQQLAMLLKLRLQPAT